MHSADRNSLAGDDLWATPGWFPFLLDLSGDRILMVRMTEGDYRAAGFLDQRSLAPDTERRSLSWREVAANVPADARRDAQYIFHIGHVGSTLVSRLLGELDSVFALREPLVLRSLAETLGPPPAGAGGPSAPIDAVTALLSRTFRPGQRSLVKATSFASEIADQLLPPRSRALFLYVDSRRYIETILAGDASRRELAMLAPARLERLRTRCPELGWRVEGLSEARLAAMAWACEMTSLERCAAELPRDRVMWIDFDRLLSDPAAGLAAASAFLGHGGDRATLEAICAGPLMRRYSKALEYEYSPRLRQEVLAQAGRLHGRHIDAALDWLKQAGQRCPPIARALERTA